MLMVGFFSWWFGAGWRDQVRRVVDSLARLADWFSIGLLIKTLFAPFRQISANDESAGSKLRAFGDRLISRIIGAIMRLFMIVFGTIALLVFLVLSLFRLLLWPTILLLPVIGFLLMLTVGAPWKIL